MVLRRNVLLFHSGALGDFVLSWPLAAALGRIHPQSRIIYVSPASKGALAEKVLRIESVDSEAGWHGLFTADAGKLPERCTKLLAGAHSVYAFGSDDDDGRWVRNVRSFTNDAEVITLPARPTEGHSRHATHALLDGLSNMPVVRTAVEQILASITSRGLGTVRLASSSGGPVVIHPGSGSPAKCWPVERFAALARLLMESGRPAKFVLGEVERDRFSPAEIRSLESAAPLVWSETYLNLLGELAAASAFVGNDSGPGHLAGIIGVPTVSLFGPTDANVWKPLGPRVAVVTAGTMDGISLDQVAGAVTSLAG